MPRLRTWRRLQGSHSSETWTQYVVQPTHSIYQLSSWYGKTFRKKSGKLFRGRELILMKLKLHVSQAGSSTNSPHQSVKSTSSTSSSTSPYLQYSGGVSLYAWCRYSWVFMLLKCGAGVTTRQVWSESSHGVTRPMISKNWTDFILKWTGLYTLELTTHWPQSWLCGNTLVVMTHTKFP